MDLYYQRVLDRIYKIDGPLDTQCWICTYALNDKGYSHFLVGSKFKYCHVFMYEFKYGPVPKGLVLDHLCRRHDCCNPDHEEPVTRRENMARGNHINAQALRTNICINGHSLKNAYINKGRRHCRTCRNNYSLGRTDGNTNEDQWAEILRYTGPQLPLYIIKPIDLGF